jgi:phosphohistidine phosphatase
VRQTLETFGGAYGQLPEIRFDQELYLAGFAALRRCLALLDAEIGTVLLVGHNPGLHQLVLELAAPDDGLRGRVVENLPTAAVAILEIPIRSWGDLGQGTARIVDLVFPRELED